VRCAMWRAGRREPAGIMCAACSLTTPSQPLLQSSAVQMDGNFGITGAIAEMLLHPMPVKSKSFRRSPKRGQQRLVQGLKARATSPWMPPEWRQGHRLCHTLAHPATSQGPGQRRSQNFNAQRMKSSFARLAMVAVSTVSALQTCSAGSPVSRPLRRVNYARPFEPPTRPAFLPLPPGA